MESGGIMENAPVMKEAFKGAPGERISWGLFFAVIGLVTAAGGLLARNVYYTEGEVMQAVYRVAVGFAALLSILAGIRHRALGLWLTVVLGGALVLWQALQTRRWGILHEEVVRIVRHAGEHRASAGSYPENLEGYRFLHPGCGRQIRYSGGGESFRLDYFLNDPGITYWYDSRSRFGYYPD